jgi:hypothetical protein
VGVGSEGSACGLARRTGAALGKGRAQAGRVCVWIGAADARGVGERTGAQAGSQAQAGKGGRGPGRRCHDPRAETIHSLASPPRNGPFADQPYFVVEAGVEIGLRMRAASGKGRARKRARERKRARAGGDRGSAANRALRSARPETIRSLASPPRNGPFADQPSAPTERYDFTKIETVPPVAPGKGRARKRARKRKRVRAGGDRGGAANRALRSARPETIRSLASPPRNGPFADQPSAPTERYDFTK